MSGSQNVLFFCREMSKITSVCGALSQTPLEKLTTLPHTPKSSGDSLPSAIAASRLCRLIPLYPSNKNARPLAPPNTKF